jgi:hypothetical protein
VWRRSPGPRPEPAQPPTRSVLWATPAGLRGWPSGDRDHDLNGLASAHEGDLRDAKTCPHVRPTHEPQVGRAADDCAASERRHAAVSCPCASRTTRASLPAATGRSPRTMGRHAARDLESPYLRACFRGTPAVLLRAVRRFRRLRQTAAPVCLFDGPAHSCSRCGQLNAVAEPRGHGPPGPVVAGEEQAQVSHRTRISRCGRRGGRGRSGRRARRVERGRGRRASSSLG